MSTTPSSPLPPLWRRALASAAALGTIALLVYAALRDRHTLHAADLPLLSWPLATLGTAALLAHGRSFGSQLLARASLWAVFIFTFLASTCASDAGMCRWFALVCAGLGGALLSLGPARLLAAEGGTFAPVAYRGALTCMLVMALADVQVLLLYGLGELSDHHGLRLPLLLAALMAVSVAGVYRLRLWGFLLNALANLLVATLSLSLMKYLPAPLRGGLVVTAAAQLALTVPLFWALVRRAPPGAFVPSRAWRWAAPAALCLLSAVALWGGFLRHVEY